MFSIIIPLYNKEHTILRTLFSVLQQTYTNFEVIIVNDGSTDNSVEVVKSFSSDQRIRIIEQFNQGVSVARNNGVSSSKFDYVAFIDGDDEWMPCFLEKIYEAIQKYPHAGIYGTSSWHRDLITGEGNDSTLEKYRKKIEKVDFFTNPHILLPHTSAIVIPKKIFEFIDENGFPIGMRMKEDMTCFYNISLIAPVVYIGFPLSIRNNNVNGQITGECKTGNYSYLNDEIRFHNINFNFFLKQKTINEKFICFKKFEIRNFIIFLLRRRENENIKLFLESLGDIKKLFCKYEIELYQTKRLNRVCILYILITKFFWKIRKNDI